MKVKPEYFSERNYYRPEVVRGIASWCNQYCRECEADNNQFYSRIAKQLKTMVFKRYSRNGGYYEAFVPLCDAWEHDPLEAVDFLAQRKLADPKRVVLKPGAEEISAKTII